MIRKIFIWTSPLPLLILSGLLIALDLIQGWEKLGIFVYLVVPLALSLFMTVMGVVLIVRARKKSEPVAALWVSTLVAGSIFLFFLALQMMNAIDKIIG